MRWSVQTKGWELIEEEIDPPLCGREVDLSWVLTVVEASLSATCMDLSKGELNIETLFNFCS